MRSFVIGLTAYLGILLPKEALRRNLTGRLSTQVPLLRDICFECKHSRAEKLALRRRIIVAEPLCRLDTSDKQAPVS
jgi:hypothetical protein